jgi:hypothetical protein
MVARERDGRRAETLGHYCPRARSQCLARFGADGDDDQRRRRANGIEVEPIVRARDDVLAEKGVVPGAVILGWESEIGGIRRGVLGENRPGSDLRASRA